MRRFRKKIEMVTRPKSEMPIEPFNLPIDETVGYYSGGGEDSYLTSAYCDNDRIQWVYRREVARGLSHSERMRCECCNRELYVSEARGQFMSSTVSPEIVGWLIEESKEILALVLTESSLETTKGVLPAYIQGHEFSGSITAVKLYQSPFVFRTIGSSNKKELLSSLQYLSTLKVSKRKRKLKKIVLKKENPRESPLFVSDAIRKKYAKQLQNYLRSGGRILSTRRTTSSSGAESKISAAALKTLSLSMGKHLNLFSQWKRQAKALQPTRAGATTGKGKGG